LLSWLRPLGQHLGGKLFSRNIQFGHPPEENTNIHHFSLRRLITFSWLSVSRTCYPRGQLFSAKRWRAKPDVWHLCCRKWASYSWILSCNCP
jgi:hypothetical protein